MKNTRKHSRHPAYPNEADKSYFVQKTVDMITAVISAAGLVFAMLFLMLLL